MKLYLIRHGKTLHNVENRHQDETSELLPDSLNEVSILASKLKALDAQAIISSPFGRTVKTAEIINEVLNLPFEIDDSLKEIKRPTVVEGRLKTDEEVIQIKNLMFENRANKEWHHSDEENFYDLKDRVLGFVKRMEDASFDKVLVVTHNAIIKTIVMLVLFGEDLDVETFHKFYNKTSISNGGLVTCEYKNGDWKLKNFNVML